MATIPGETVRGLERTIELKAESDKPGWVRLTIHDPQGNQYIALVKESDLKRAIATLG